MNNKTKIVADQASIEAYLKALFVGAVNTQVTPTKSNDEILLTMAMSYGRAFDEAKEDVKRILNVGGAVSLLKSVVAKIIIDET